MHLTGKMRDTAKYCIMHCTHRRPPPKKKNVIDAKFETLVLEVQTSILRVSRSYSRDRQKTSNFLS